MLKRLFASRKHPYIPGIDTPERIEFDLSGNKLSLTLPPHSDYEGFEARQAPVKQLNMFDESVFNEPEKPFARSLFVKRTWELYGAIWNSRPVGSISFAAIVEKVNCLPEEMSCLNPNHFEQVINLLMYQMGPASPELGEMLAPVNWQLSTNGEVTWSIFEMHKDMSKLSSPAPFTAAQYSSFAITPLDDRFCLRLLFHNSGYAPVEHANQHMNEVRDEVLRSAELTLNPSAEQRLKQIKKQNPDASLSKKRELENWQYPEWRGGYSSKGEPPIVILKPGSAAPKFTP